MTWRAITARHCLWDALSPVEHLGFYGRLKGVPADLLPHHTQRWGRAHIARHVIDCHFHSRN